MKDGFIYRPNMFNIIYFIIYIYWANYLFIYFILITFLDTPNICIFLNVFSYIPFQFAFSHLFLDLSKCFYSH